MNVIFSWSIFIYIGAYQVRGIFNGRDRRLNGIPWIKMYDWDLICFLVTHVTFFVYCC